MWAGEQDWAGQVETVTAKDTVSFPPRWLPHLCSVPFGTGKGVMATGDIATWSHHSSSWDAETHC